MKYIDTIITVRNGRPIGYETSSEFAKRVGVDKDTVRVWISRGKINSLKIGNDHWIENGTERPNRRKRTKKEKGL